MLRSYHIDRIDTRRQDTFPDLLPLDYQLGYVVMLGQAFTMINCEINARKRQSWLLFEYPEYRLELLRQNKIVVSYDPHMACDGES
jgi:hypothetical protein